MSTPTIENIIVVMLENRSYDNVLGGLYLASNPAPYNAAPTGQTGLNGLADSSGQPGNYSNPNPSSSGETIPIGNQATPTQLAGAGTYYPPTTIPVIDPGEYFSDMAWQITGSQQSGNPYSTWPPSSTTNLMQGFTGNYANQSNTGSNIADIMNYFTPTQMPVTAWLANNFGVCDQWYASAPTQTYTNRAFAHCAAPAVMPASGKTAAYSLIDNIEYFVPVTNLTCLPSIFSVLDTVYTGGSTPNWKVYFHDYSNSILTVPYVYNAAFSSSNVNVGTYDNSDWGTATPMPLMNLTPFASNLQGSLGGSPTTFLYDLANNSLPMYSFIEPRYSCAIGGNAPTVKHIAFNNSPNSNHPGSAFAPAPVSSALAPIDVADGEAFLKQLYNALNQSNYWGKTLLIITYDEHGGLYDHVAPPTATPPGQTTGTNSITIPDCSNTFGFNVYGCRVPTIVVSPYISPGSRIQPVSGRFDHTSLIRTAWDCLFTYANPPRTPAVSSLTQRDAEGNAASLYPSLDFSLSNNPGQL